jgi:tetratricopeptide (TPR) repeat protein
MGEAIEGKIIVDLPGGWAQITGLNITGGALEKGYSGAGVFDPTLKAMVGMIAQADKDKERKIGQFVGTDSLQKALKGGDPTLVTEDPTGGTAIPEFLPDDRVVRVFVGRSQDVERVLATVRKQRIAQKSRPKPGTSLFWYYGFGGMGKSWLLRRLAYLSGKPVTGAQSRPAVLMLDWNPNDRWSALATKVSDPRSVFSAIAIRAVQVYGPDIFQPFWNAYRHIDWASLRFVRFQMALRALASATTKSADPPVASGADTIPIKLDSDQAIRDGAILKGILREKKLWPDELKDLPGLSRYLEGNGPSQDEIFTAWAELIVSPEQVDRSLIVRPLSHLADVLRECLRKGAETRPLFLLLDTCEELDEWTEYWLRRLLAPLLASATPIVAVVGTRSRPDRYLRPGERGGWLEELPGRISHEPFDKGRYLQVSEIEKLLRLSKTSVKGVDRSTLAHHLHRVTRGIPYGLGLLMDSHNSDLLSEVAKWDEIAGEELNASKAAQRVNEELAIRYFLHVKNEKDKGDLFALALIPGIEEDFEDDREWYFRFRPLNRSANLAPAETVPLRDLVLASMWGSGWATRLMELERSYGLVSDGDLHPIVRHVLRAGWRHKCEEEIQVIVRRLIDALDRLRPAEGTFDQYWIAWSMWRVGFESWLPPVRTEDSLKRVAVIGLAHGQDIAELERFQFLLRKENQNRSLGTIESVWDWEETKVSHYWTSFEGACLALVKGLAKAEAGFASANVTDQLKGAEQLAPAIELLWFTLPDFQKKHVTGVYFRAVSKVTMDGDHPEILQNAVNLSEKFPMRLDDAWWGHILHNQRRYDESASALRRVLETDPQNEDALRVLFHDLAHHLERYEEALVLLDRWLEISPLYPLNRLTERGAILRKLKRFEEGISGLITALDRSSDVLTSFESRKSHALCHTELGRLRLAAGCLEQAEVDFRKAIDLYDLAETYLALGDLLQRTGRLRESLELCEGVLRSQSQGSKEWCTTANRVAWQHYLLRSDLSKGEQMALHALQADNSLSTLQTLFAIQARAGKWEAADSHFRRYLREYPIDQLTSERWADHILFFRDVIPSGKGQWVSDRIATEIPAPRDLRWEIIRLAIIGDPVEVEELRRPVETVFVQLRSDERNPVFPALPQCV